MFNLDMTQACLIAEYWCPVNDLDEIQGALVKGTVSVVSTMRMLSLLIKILESLLFHTLAIAHHKLDNDITHDIA